jgi:2-iminobutanoate/2-iminopropanoate deaminase
MPSTAPEDPNHRPQRSVNVTTTSKRFDHFGFGVPWEDAASYSQAVRSGDLLFISGQLSHAPDGTFLGEGDFEAQATATLENLDRVLTHFGAARSDIVEINVFVVDLRTNFDAALAGVKRYFDGHRPANNTIGVEALAFPEQLIEIAATVVLSDH